MKTLFWRIKLQDNSRDKINNNLNTSMLLLTVNIGIPSVLLLSDIVFVNNNFNALHQSNAYNLSLMFFDVAVAVSYFKNKDCSKYKQDKQDISCCPV